MNDPYLTDLMRERQKLELPPIEHRCAPLRDILIRLLVYAVLFAFSVGILWLVLMLTAKAANSVFL